MIESGQAQRFTGWGRTAPSVATLLRARTSADVVASLRATGERGVTARGLGRAYGDAAQNGGGTVLDCTTMNAIAAVDVHRQTIVVGGGAGFDRIARAAGRAGLALPVVPGTRFVTAGGAIAADVHGKSHHVDGSFGAHVEAFTLVCPDGAVRAVTRESDRALFDATLGGMRLTGVITSATLRLTPTPSSLITVTTEHARDFDATMDALTAAQARHRYAVAWIDLASGRGRGIVDGADRLTEPLGAFSNRARRLIARAAIPIPVVPPVSLVGRASVRVYNALRFRRSDRHQAIQAFDAFNAPLDVLGAWHRLYGPRGLVQYQFALPSGEEAALRTITRAILGAPAVPALAVLKRFGPGDGAPLSFPVEGWTLAVDFPAVAGDAFTTFLDTLDRRVAAAGGRVYLAKDARMRAEMIPLMYPRIDEWRETQARVDPYGVLTSDLDRRLRLTAARAQ